MKKKEGRTGGSLKVCDERLQQYFQLPWKLFTAHKLPGRNTSLSPSHHPSDRPPSRPNEAGLFLCFGVIFLKEEREKVKRPSLSFLYFITFIFLFLYVFFFFSFLGGGRFITMEEGNSKTQTQKVEDDLSPPSAPLSSSFFPPPPPPLFFLSCAYVGREKDRERREMRKEEGMKGNKQGRNVVKWAQM